MERTFADASMSRTPHKCTINDIGGRWRNQIESPFKQRVLGSSPRRLISQVPRRRRFASRHRAAGNHLGQETPRREAVTRPRRLEACFTWLRTRTRPSVRCRCRIRLSWWFASVTPCFGAATARAADTRMSPTSTANNANQPSSHRSPLHSPFHKPTRPRGRWPNEFLAVKDLPPSTLAGRSRTATCRSPVP
jgi:hypothetical protein